MMHPAVTLLDSLTDEQANAAFTPTSSVSVVRAGPGTGKTRVLTARIARMVLDGEDPEQIRALVFTRSAAVEIRSRLRTVIGEAANDVDITTIHAWAYRMICAERAEHDLRPLSVATEIESDAFKASIYDGPLRLPSRRRVGIDHLQAAILARDAGTRCDTEADGCLNVVLSRLDAAGLIPTWDLLPMADSIFEDNRESGVDHVLVDEAQDLTPREWSIIGRMYGGGLFVVGDPNQAIMGWRGAVGMDGIPEEAGYTSTIRQSFRFGPSIAALANRIIPGADVIGTEDRKTPEAPTRAALFRTWHDASEWVAGQGCESEFKVGRSRSNMRAVSPHDADRVAGIGPLALTVHSAKGSEWDIVDIPGPMVLSEGPEERRVQFVAVTRARSECHVEIVDGPAD